MNNESYKPYLIGVFTQTSSVIPIHSRRNEIYYVDGYGVTCPSLVTSNGVAEMVAKAVHANTEKFIKNDVSDYTCSLEVLGSKIETSSIKHILDALLIAVKRYKS